jgi:ubiquinone/menaquinone biosynthesis C-methylase UbiE
MAQDIDKSYERFYAARAGERVYPTEFVVRTFLAQYPGLSFPKPAPGSRMLDVAFGDGRNTVFLCDRGYDVSGIEITAGIVEQTAARLEKLGKQADLRVGRNSSIPFEDATFDCILACHCCYYCDESESFATNMQEYARVLRPGGWLVASVASADSYIFQGATVLEDGSRRVQGDPYGNRNGYRLQAFSAPEDIKQYLAPWFHNFSIGFAGNDYFGREERVFWVVCQKK